MPFLYEKIDTLREVGVSKELVQYIPDNLNPSFELRPYQTAAFENFITYLSKADTNAFSYGNRLRQDTYHGRAYAVSL